MMSVSTIEQLKAMKFSAMAKAFQEQINDPKTFSALGFEERFGLMVDAEWNKRQDNKRLRYVRDAHLDIPTACMEDIEYHQDRGLDKKQLLRLSTCAFIEEKHHVILRGAAGTGKTYLAVAMAVKALKSGDIDRIILTRPAVEAGENLGFLPGDLQEKVDPYLRPLYDALFEMLGAEAVERDLEKNIIEIAPLAYMRGRTLDHAFIILDEAQNTTSEQIKMFLTRLGEGSKMVITGDITQIDLPDPKRSGLIEAMRVLKSVDDIAIHQFSEKDVVRHKLVQDIITAYANDANNERRNAQNHHERKKNRNG